MLFLSTRDDPGAIRGARGDSLPVAVWLLICCAMVFSMVILGGVTRLTGSGLSMVDWQPIKGVIPPLSDADWLRVFEQYQQFPEFRYVNRDMDVEGFKFIFMFEYGHRLLGRLIGLAFFLPLVWFWWTGRLPRPVKPHLIALFVLGGLQGLLGWFMVMSGLADEPRVSQYRLTAHLCLAVAIYGYMLIIALGLLDGPKASFLRHGRRATKIPHMLVAVVFLMIASGGFVAGTHAGYIYNSFPTMHGQWIPHGVLALSPAWLNLFENPVTIQFAHRMLAVAVLAAAVYGRVALARAGLRSLVPYANALLAAVLLQIGLGIVTLVNQVPVPLGAIHQAGSLVVFTAALVLFQRSGRPGEASWRP